MGLTNERSFFILRDVGKGKKGQATRQAIVARAVDLASTVGLDGVTIGMLADDLKVSKSGLFAHFGSKLNLQLAIIEAAKTEFTFTVMVPAIRKPRGEARVRAFFEKWVEWGERPGGCFFVSTASEMDDQPGPVRDALRQAQRDWLNELALAARIAVESKDFRADLDAQQFAFEFYSLMLGLHHFSRFLGDPKALKRTRHAFENLIEDARRR